MWNYIIYWFSLADCWFLEFCSWPANHAELWRLHLLVLPVLSLTGLFRAAQSQWSLITPCAGLELPIQSCILLHTVQLLLIRTPDDDCENLHSICTSRRRPAPVGLIVRSFHRRCFHRQAKCFLHGHGRHSQHPRRPRQGLRSDWMKLGKLFLCILSHLPACVCDGGQTYFTN